MIGQMIGDFAYVLHRARRPLILACGAMLAAAAAL